MSDPVAIERRDDARLSTLERVFGTGDMAQMIQATKANVNAAIAFAREREFVSEYPIMKKGRQVGVRLWFHHPTWQLLGQSFGVTAYTEGEPKEVKPGTWQASAIACMIENGQVVGRAVGICSKTEPGAAGKPPPKANMPDHSLAATAQSRAQRNALRSCLGAVLIAAGFEISDPEGPATKEQLAVLHILEREIGWTHDEAHADAGVTSFTKLTRDQASDVIDRWTAMRDELQGGADASLSGRSEASPASRPEPSDASSTSLSGVGAEESPEPEEALGKGAEGAGDSSPTCKHPSWKRSEGELRCTKCGTAKKDSA